MDYNNDPQGNNNQNPNMGYNPNNVGYQSQPNSFGTGEPVYQTQPVNNSFDGNTYQEPNFDNNIPNNSNPEEKRKSTGFAIASLVLGILSIVFICCCIPWLNLILAVLAIVFAIIDKNKPTKTGVSTGGLVCGIIGLLISLVLMLFSGVLFTGLRDAIRSAGYDIEDFEDMNDVEFDEFMRKLTESFNR